MRTALYILLFANLAFLAWAGWIDTPARAPADQAIAGLPRLMLAAEAQGESRSRSANSGTTSARCVSVGPFDTSERVAAAISLFQQRGFEPHQREELGETFDGFWVYVGGLESAAEERRVLRILEQAQLTDAQAMPETEAGRRVSVGVFSERNRAERRARALRRLGLEPEIGERRVPGTVYRVDLYLGPNDGAVSTEGLLAEDEAGARLEVRACPALQSPPASG